MPADRITHRRQLAERQGRSGESWAALLLRLKGYRILGRRVRTHAGEIDLVARSPRGILCFIEVKTRASDEFAAPQANVDLRKRRQIARAARGYRRMLGLTGTSYRYDVVTVVLPSGKQKSAEPRIELLKSFWTDEKLRKVRWQDARWD